jgi:hypothetical protein
MAGQAPPYPAAPATGGGAKYKENPQINLGAKQPRPSTFAKASADRQVAGFPGFFIIFVGILGRQIVDFLGGWGYFVEYKN